MSVLLSKIVLVYIVSAQPLLHFQIVDAFSDEATCSAVIAKVAEQEKNEPADEQIHERLGCIRLSHRYDPDGDGPEKPVAPLKQSSINNSIFNSNERVETYPCKNTLCKPSLCRETATQ